MRFPHFLRLLIAAAIALCALSSPASPSLAQEAPRLRILNLSSAQTITMQMNGRNITVPVQGRISEVSGFIAGDNIFSLSYTGPASRFGASIFGIRAKAGERYLLVLYGSLGYLIVDEGNFLVSASGMAHVLFINGDIRAETVTVSLTDNANIERYRAILTVGDRPMEENRLTHRAAAALFIAPDSYLISSTAGGATLAANLMSGRVYIVVVSGLSITLLEGN